MAGDGKRFTEEGYTVAKPFIKASIILNTLSLAFLLKSELESNEGLSRDFNSSLVLSICFPPIC